MQLILPVCYHGCIRSTVITSQYYIKITSLFQPRVTDGTMYHFGPKIYYKVLNVFSSHILHQSIAVSFEMRQTRIFSVIHQYRTLYHPSPKEQQGLRHCWDLQALLSTINTISTKVWEGIFPQNRAKPSCKMMHMYYKARQDRCRGTSIFSALSSSGSDIDHNCSSG